MSVLITGGPVLVTIRAPGGQQMEYKLTDVKIKPIHKTEDVSTDPYGSVPLDHIYQAASLKIRGDFYPGIIPGERDPARQLAYAILDGDEQAVFPLIDYLLENREKPLTTDQRVGVVRLDQEELNSIRSLSLASKALRKIIQQLERNK